jgi:hypothetical protein
MKLKIVAFVSAMMLNGLVCRGQSHEITINPFLFAFDNYSGAYFFNAAELPFSLGMTLGIVTKLEYTMPEEITITSNFSDPIHRGFYLAPEFRFVAKPEDDNTNWAGLYLKYSRYATSDNAYTFTTLQGPAYSFDVKHTRTSVGLNFGRNWNLQDIFIISGWMGFGYVFYNDLRYTNGVQNVNGEEVIFLLRLDIRAGISVGIRI